MYTRQAPGGSDLPRHLFHRTGVVVPALAVAVTAAAKPAMADPTQILAAQQPAGGSGIQTGTGTTGSRPPADVYAQVKCGLWYIKSVYGTPCAAWQNEVEYHSC